MEREHDWMVVARVLEMARFIAGMSTCTCRDRSTGLARGVCRFCRLVAAEDALVRLILSSLVYSRTLRLQGEGARQAEAREMLGEMWHDQQTATCQAGTLREASDPGNGNEDASGDRPGLRYVLPGGDEVLTPRALLEGLAALGFTWVP